MTENYQIEKVYEKQWEKMRAQLPLFEFACYAIHLIGIPIFSFLCLITSTWGTNVGFQVLNFLAWSLPYILIISITYRVANRNLKRQQGKKLDQAIVIYWVNNGIGLLVLSVLCQCIAILIMEGQLGLVEKEKVTALVWLCLSDLVFAVIVLKFRNKIINRSNQRGKNVQNRSRAGLISHEFIIGLVIFFSIIIFTLGFHFSSFLDFRMFTLFVLVTLSSFLVLFSLLISYQNSIKLIFWRKRTYWDKDMGE